jgi:Putative metallopeptidase
MEIGSPHVHQRSATRAPLTTTVTAVALTAVLAACQRPPDRQAATPPPPPRSESALPLPLPPPSRGHAPAAPAERFVVNVTSDEAAPPPRQRIVGARTVRSLADQLSDLFAMREEVFVELRACGKPDAAYDAAMHRITICDEFLDNAGQLFSGLTGEPFEQAIVYTVGFTFLHEAGHALIEQLGLPVADGEEDMADRFAAYILAGNPDADPAALSGGASFGPAFAAKPAQLELDWDGRTLEPQRFVTLNCWVLGSNPDGYPWLVDPNVVPADRAAGCPSEWTKLERSLSTLLAPHLR